MPPILDPVKAEEWLLRHLGSALRGRGRVLSPTVPQGSSKMSGPKRAALVRLLIAGEVERVSPEGPRYRLTEKGKARLAEIEKSKEEQAIHEES